MLLNNGTKISAPFLFLFQDLTSDRSLLLLVLSREENVIMYEEASYTDDLILLQSCVMTLLLGYYLYIRPRVCTRRYWVRPVNRTRYQRGHYFTLFKEMETVDPEQFFVYTRMTPVQFRKLLRLVRPHLKKRSHRAISPEERLVITLKFLSQGGTMQTLMWEFCLGKATISKIIKETCTCIWNALAPVYLQPPTREKFTNIANEFYHEWNYPNCLGAIDGKHVIIQCPSGGGSQYFCYKKQHSIILMAACDSKYRFTFVDIGGYGSQGDLAIFRSSAFGDAIINNTLETPDAIFLPQTQIKVQYHFVADEAFPLRTNIMRPFPGRYLDDAKRIFNYRLSRARRTIENAFGILSSRWRIFRGPIVAGVDTVDAIVKATVALHNFLKSDEESVPANTRKYGPSQFADSEDANGNIVLGQWRNDLNAGILNLGRVGSNRAQNDAQNMREYLKAFFISQQGEVPWQYRVTINGGGMVPQQ